MKIIGLIIFCVIGFQSYSMIELVEVKSSKMEFSLELSENQRDRKKRINKKRKRKCSKWGKRSFAG